MSRYNLADIKECYIRASEELEEELGRQPTDAEVAERADDLYQSYLDGLEMSHEDR
jgi:DNA-directed RNA polymerase specialized sigma subunit